MDEADNNKEEGSDAAEVNLKKAACTSVTSAEKMFVAAVLGGLFVCFLFLGAWILTTNVELRKVAETVETLRANSATGMAEFICTPRGTREQNAEFFLRKRGLY